MVTEEIINKKKKQRINKTELGPNFIAPDGGYGWFIAISAGCSNLCTFPILQQFGLIFRNRLEQLNITNSQITTIINLNSALTSCVGLANGPLFRRFSYRQIAFVGAIIVGISLVLTSVANSFGLFILTFSVLYGAGIGITTSANSLALNTYFKEKRRMATGFSWTTTAFGPIIMPYVSTGLLSFYGVPGTVLIFGGFAFNAMVCSLILHPVQWHTTKQDPEISLINEPKIECKFCKSMKRKNHSIFSSQYLYNADDNLTAGYEIIDPGTPMLSHANDGWFSISGKRSLYNSKLSLTSVKTSKYNSRKTSNQNLVISNRTSYTNLGDAKQDGRRDKLKEKSNNVKILEVATEDCPSYKAPQDLLENEKNILPESTTPSLQIINEHEYIQDNYSIKSYNKNNSNTTNSNIINNYNSEQFRKRSNTFNIEKEVLRVASKKLQQYIENDKEKQKRKKKLYYRCTCDEEHLLLIKEKELQQEYENRNNDNDDDDDEVNKFTLWEKITLFFDLDLLKDYSYVNQMIGITIANFSEINFSLLTPFLLNDFGLTEVQIAQAMSLLGLLDLGVRFFIPFIAGKIGWENRTFFLFGVLGMALGRIVLAHYRSYGVTLVVFSWIGLNKGLRTVFMALIIPSHVSLKKLPGATGLQLLFAGIFFMLMGPIVGWIRDVTNYTVTLHFLNITTYLTAISWGIEKLYYNTNKNSI